MTTVSSATPMQVVLGCIRTLAGYELGGVSPLWFLLELLLQSPSMMVCDIKHTLPFPNCFLLVIQHRKKTN